MDQLAEHARLGLTAQAQKEHIVLGEDRIANLGNDGLFITQDIGKQGLARRELGDQVSPHFVLDGLDSIPARLELAQSSGPILHRHWHCLSFFEFSAHQQRISDTIYARQAGRGSQRGPQCRMTRVQVKAMADAVSHACSVIEQPADALAAMDRNDGVGEQIGDADDLQHGGERLKAVLDRVGQARAP